VDSIIEDSINFNNPTIVSQALRAVNNLTNDEAAKKYNAMTPPLRRATP
jgi:hypothetical protein